MVAFVYMTFLSPLLMKATPTSAY